MTADSRPAMPLPVLYRAVAPLNREIHRGLRLRPTAEPLAFARGTHLMPALVDEFPKAACDLPIVFLPEGEMISPVFMLGLKPGTNRFVSPKGLWTTPYIPAYVRRYPFLLADVEGRDPVLCFDEQFEGIGTAEGEPLFDDAGAPTPTLKGAMTFAGGFREAGQRTLMFVQRLRELDLFKPVTMDVTASGAPAATISGLLLVDEEKLRKLPDATVLEFHRNGVLGAIHAHLMSLGKVPSLA
jgi:SapC